MVQQPHEPNISGNIPNDPTDDDTVGPSSPDITWHWPGWIEELIHDPNNYHNLPEGWINEPESPETK